MRLVHIDPINGSLRVTLPAWFDPLRPLREVGAVLKRRPTDGWTYTQPDTTPLTEARGELIISEDDIRTVDGNTIFAETREEYLTRVISRLQSLGVIPSGVSGTAYHEITDARVPERIFRGAWGWTGKITTNMAKARVIHLNRIRKVRDAELAKLDVPYLLALETGDATEQQRIASLKQQLRDIPQTFGLSQFSTAATLNRAWPPELPNPVVSQVEP